MAWGGSAPNQTYTRTDGVRSGTAVNAQAKAAAVNDTAALADARENDFATAINEVWKRDGGNQPTANIPMNDKKFTGLAQGSARTDSLRIDQVQDGDLLYAGTVGGSANAIELTMSPASGGPVEGMMVLFIPGSDNTNAVTVDLDSDGAAALEQNSTALAGGELQAGQPAIIIHDGTNWQLANTDVLAVLASTASGRGASLIGIEDSGGLITATTVEGALAENRTAIDAIEADYLTSSDIGSSVQAYDDGTITAAAVLTDGQLVVGDGGSYGVKTYAKAKSVGATDLDDLLAPGFYDGNNLTNSPDGTTNYFYIMVQQHSTQNTYISQTAWNLTTNNDGMWYRIRNAGTWQSWRQLQPYDADILKADTSDDLTAGFTSTSSNQGTKSSGTFTPTFATRNIQHCVNGGAFTLGVPTGNGSLILDITNNASAGAITTSSYDIVTGDDFDTTNTNAFRCYITVGNAGSHLHVVALQ